MIKTVLPNINRLTVCVLLLLLKIFIFNRIEAPFIGAYLR